MKIKCVCMTTVYVSSYLFEELILLYVTSVYSQRLVPGCSWISFSLALSSLSLSMCEDLHRDLYNCELQAHEHKESSGRNPWWSHEGGVVD